jgi:FemAB-related protein (PEP-CTERM system-associated)
MPELRVRQLEREQAAAWPEALVTAGTFASLDAWSNLVRSIYRYDIYRLEATLENEVVGILALTHVHHPLFGNYLATSPFGSYGGFAFASAAARDALLKQAQRLADELRVEYTVVRFLENGNEAPAPWLQNPIYSTYLLDLTLPTDAMMQFFASDHRNHVRKSLKKGFTIKFGHLDLLDDLYEALSKSMHELGSPYHHKKYLRCMAESLGDAVEFVVAYSPQNELAGAGVFIAQDAVVTNLHANILRRFRSDYAGEFLYWSVICHHVEKGYQVLDLGRSLNGSGNETFKLKWRPRQVPLAYWYYLPRGSVIPELNQKSPKFRFAIWLWKRLPAFMVRAMGPGLIRGIV